MATEAAQAEVPAPPPPTTATGASPQKRVLPVVPGEGGEERPPEPKRRRACVAALDGVACAVTAASGPGSNCDASFSFQHAGGRFVALETTPKFGSFNPPAAAEQAGLDVKTDGEGLPEADEQVASSSSSSGAEEDGCKEENSHSPSVGVEPGGDQGHTDKNGDTVPTSC